MKKVKYLLVFILIIIITQGSINAKCLDKGDNLSKFHDEKNEVISTFDCSTGKLIAYGTNLHGNLGTGNYSNIPIAQKVDLNSKVGNKKIVDYVFMGKSTYLLSEDGKVYVSGTIVPDGVAKKRNTFVPIVFNKNNTIKITELSVGNMEVIDGVDIEFKTSNKSDYYRYEHKAVYYNNRYSSSRDTYFKTIWEAKASPTFKNPIYYHGSSYTSEVDNKGSLLYIYSGKGNNETAKKYRNNKIYRKDELNTKQYRYTKYSNGKRTNLYITYYKKWTDLEKKPKESSRVYYSYNKYNKINKRNTYKYSKKNKRYLYSVKTYKYNRKQELKSNKNGKASTQILYYKSGKVSLKSKYYYNSKGKVSLKYKYYYNKKGKIYRKYKYVYNKKGKVIKKIKIK